EQQNPQIFFRPALFRHGGLRDFHPRCARATSRAKPRNPNRTDDNESLSERPTLSTRRHRAQVCARWWCVHPRSRPRFFGVAAQVGSKILECSTPRTPAMIYIKEARRPKPTGVMAPTLEMEVQYLKGVGPQRAALLAERGIYTVEDLLGHLPFRYEDRIRFTTIQQAQPGGTYT